MLNREQILPGEILFGWNTEHLFSLIKTTETAVSFLYNKVMQTWTFAGYEERCSTSYSQNKLFTSWAFEEVFQIFMQPLFWINYDLSRFYLLKLCYLS